MLFFFKKRPFGRDAVFTSNTDQSFPRLLYTFEVVKSAIQEFDKSIISISPTHGDFQYANILRIDRQNIIIIDWESVNQRYIGYDYLTFILEAICNKGVISWYAFQEKLGKDKFISAFIGMYISKIHNIRKSFILYLKEDFYYQIENTCASIFYHPCLGLNILLEEFNKSLQEFSLVNSERKNNFY